MDIEVFRQILAKIKSESLGEPLHLNLYNWGEAFIHPQLPLFLEEISKQGFTVDTSTNFNGEFDLRPIVRAYDGQITNFRVSLSGFSQEIYKRGHRGGNISLVKSNLYRLRHYMDTYKKDIPVYIFYHIYRDNIRDEIAAMERFCHDLGFGFRTGWAYLMPIEKVMTALNVDFSPALQGSARVIPVNRADAQGPAKLSQADLDIVSRLVMSVEKMAEIGQKVKMDDCPLRSEQTVINYDGSVALCCGLYDPAFTIAKSFLDIPRAELQKRKYEHRMCNICFDNNIAQITLQSPYKEWDDIGNKVLRASGGSKYMKLRGARRTWVRLKKQILAKIM